MSDADEGLVSTEEVFANVEKMILLADGDRDHSASSALKCNDTMVALHLLRHLKSELEKSTNQLVSMRSETIEECAKIAEAAPAQTLYFWDRPGGPPGNGYRVTTGKDIAATIRLSKLRGAESVFVHTDEQHSKGEKS